MANDPIHRNRDERCGTHSSGQHAVRRCLPPNLHWPAAGGTAGGRNATADGPVPPRQRYRITPRCWSPKPETNADQPRSASTWATALLASASRS